MKFKWMMLAVFFVCLFAISAVSAADNATDNIVGVEETTGEVVSVEENQLSNQTDNNDVLGADDGTFTALQNKMSSASESSTITLENDYASANIINPTTTSQGSGVDKLETNVSAVYDVGARELVATLVNVDEGKFIKGATVVVNIEGIEHNGQTDSKGQVSFSTVNLNIGDYTAVISYKGNSKYNPSSTITEFSVNKVDSSISAFYDKKFEELIVTLTNAVGGNGLIGATVLVNFGGTDYVLRTDSKGQVKISTADLALGSYPISISYNGNSKYYSSNYVGVVNTKFGTNISAFYDSDSKELIITASNLVNGNGLVGATILITLNGNDYALRTDSKGQVIVSTDDLAVGIYTAYVSYNGNSKYNPSSANVIVNNRLDTNISAFYDGASRQLVITASNLVSGNGLFGATILITLNGNDHVLRTDSKGQVNVSTVNLNIGDYTAVISYKGNSKYNPSSTITEFSVNKVDSSISAFYDKKFEELIVTLTNAVGGNGLIGATVLVNFSGTDYILRTDSKGQVKISTADLALGIYPVSISYNGNSKYYSSNYTTIVNTKFDTNVSAVYNIKSRELVVTASNLVSGKGLAGATVLVTMEGMDYVLITNSKGQVSVSTANLNIGDYTAVISYNGNSKYNPSSTLFEFSVNKVDSSISAVHDVESEVLFVNVTNAVGGNGLVGATVLVNIDGTDYVLRTDSKGQINMSTSFLTPGIYSIAISYNGNSKYYSSGATVNVIINKINTLLTADDFYMGYGGNTSLVATLTDARGNAIEGVNIYVTFNGGSYTLTTNDEGKIQLHIGALDLGTYVATFNFAETDFYLASNAVSNVFINKASSTWYLMDSHFNSFNYGENSYLCAALKDVYGNPIANVPATVNIVRTFDLGVNENYRTDTYTTDGEGMIYLWVGNIPVGDYFINYNFAGNDYYGFSTDYYSMTISKCPTHFLIDNDFGSSVNYQENKGWSIRLIEEHNIHDYTGNGVGNANIKVIFTGGSSSQQQYVFNLKTNNDGYTTFNTKDMLPGTYDMSVEFLGDDRYVSTDRCNHYDGSYVSGIFSIKKANPTITTTGVTTTCDTEGFVTATLKDPNGNVMANRLVTFTFEDGTGRTVRTDSNGKAKLSTNGIPGGVYNIIATYTPDTDDDRARYNSVSSTSVKMTINKVKAVVYIKDIKGNWIIDKSGKPVKEYFYLNAIEYTDIVVYVENSKGNLLEGVNVRWVSHKTIVTNNKGSATFELYYYYSGPSNIYFTLEDDYYYIDQIKVPIWVR